MQNQAMSCRPPMAALNPGVRAAAEIRWVTVKRHQRVQVPAGACSLWLQMRGTGEVRAREGVFGLRKGDWIVLDRESMPVARAEGMLLGVVIPTEWVRRSGLQIMIPGRGRLGRGDIRRTLAVWRDVAATMRCEYGGDGAADRLRAALMHSDLLALSVWPDRPQCPGPSIARRRKVFARMQRARLYIEGHRHRVVRLAELAELTSFSNWYLSKKFHEIYRESPQAACVRLRLQHARELLRDTDWPIGKVGASCGFESCASFGRMFRRKFGETPSHARKQGRTSHWNKNIGDSSIAAKLPSLPTVPSMFSTQVAAQDIADHRQQRSA